MFKFKLLGILLVTGLFVGCATQPITQLTLQKDTLSSESKVVVLQNEIKEPSMDYPGASCLLCLGAAAVANGSLSNHVKTLPLDDIKTLGKLAGDKISASGAKVEVIETPLLLNKIPKAKKSKSLSVAKHDFSQYKASHQATHALVVNTTSVGVIRNYSAYVPVSGPIARIGGEVYLVNLATGEYVAYNTLDISKLPNGVWDQAPAFPNVTNAYYEAVEAARDQISNLFAF
jgi:hypothetical protein